MSEKKRNVALSSMAASAALSLGKFAVGLMTGSLGLLSEALHSLLDFGATVVTYLAVRISDKPADEDHHYGHGKIESVAALIETGLLFVTSAWIVYEAVRRLITRDTEVEASWWAVGVLLTSIVVDFWRARALSKVAKETGSQALAADALHFSSDILTSICVLVGIGLVAIGWPQGDAVAAIAVALFVCRLGWRMGRRTIDTLLDAAPSGAAERIGRILGRIDGIAKVQRVRVRPAGSMLFVDIEVAVGRGLILDQVEDIRRAIVAAVGREMPAAAVTVEAHPLALDDETVQQRVCAIAAGRGAFVHHVTSHLSDGRLSLGFDVEVDGRLSLREAHAIASGIEAALKAEFGGDTEIESHIEPLQQTGLHGSDVSEEELSELRALLNRGVAATGILFDAHAVRARRTELGLIVIFHCLAAPECSVAKVHETVDALEWKIREAFPGIWRIVVHAEPAKDG